MIKNITKMQDELIDDSIFRLVSNVIEKEDNITFNNKEEALSHLINNSKYEPYRTDDFQNSSTTFLLFVNGEIKGKIVIEYKQCGSNDLEIIINDPVYY